MTEDLRFVRTARDWLELGPVEAPADVIQAALLEIDTTPQERDLRVPWRSPRMPTFVRALAAAAVVVGLAAVGALFLQRPNQALVGGPSPSPSVPSPSASQSAGSPAALGDLSQAYQSDRYGYTVYYPTDWSVTPALTSWQPGTHTLWGDPALDTLQSRAVRLVVAAQPLAAGQSPDDWYASYCMANGNDAATCEQVVANWAPVAIGLNTGYLTLDGARAAGGTIKPGGPIYDAVAVANGYGYEFTLDGDVDKAAFERILAGVEFNPAKQVGNLTQPYTSDLYDYAILLDPHWTVMPATTKRITPLSEETFSDVITAVGTDSSIGASAAPLGKRTWEELLARLAANAQAGMPAGCDGGDPSTWATVTVAGLEGRVEQFCNAAAVYVLDGKTVYEFDWGNSTFSTTQHLTEDNFFEVLKGVTLPGSPAASPQP